MAFQNDKIRDQLDKCIHLLKNVLGHHLMGVYLYGSSVTGGLQKYSDIDLFVVSERATTGKEKQTLINSLLQISGIYMKSSKLPIELTIVVKSEINPWHYPPRFDFQYGDWLREQFESGVIEPWPTILMPDIALLITQVLLANETLFGPNPNELLCSVPYRDFILATQDSLKSLMTDLHTDTRNVLLTYARIWSTLETDTIRSKPNAALWALDRLPKEYKPVLERAKSICIGETSESWNDIQNQLQPCANFMLKEIERQFALIENTGYLNRSISLEGTFTFSRLKSADLDLLCEWLNQPHVLEWWNDHLTPAEIKQKYRNRINDTVVCPYIVSLHNKPIGFIQYYWASKVGNGWWPNENDSTVGIDQFIGDENFIDKGYGTAMIKEFVHFLFQNLAITKIITEADPNNHRARCCYQKVGFIEQGEINTPDGKSILLIFKKPQ
ncbi:MAG: Streptomycin 3-adenylyltransferase [Gammaproteobacteria bacterium]|jgi:streptomycin 3"-adenylyltransferase|nr:Streptomycin 3-adenylyltransferase [Gammaproteobacteria bacterium]